MKVKAWQTRRARARLRKQFRRSTTARHYPTRNAWGWALHVWLKDHDPTGQTAGAYGFGNYPKVGDVIIESDGTCWYVTAGERTRDPDDMWTGDVLLEPDPSIIPIDSHAIKAALGKLSWVETDLV